MQTNLPTPRSRTFRERTPTQKKKEVEFTALFLPIATVQYAHDYEVKYSCADYGMSM